MLEDLLAIAWFVKAFLYSCFAALGGLLGHLFRSLDNGRKVSLYESCVRSVGAAFSGFLVFLMCNAWGIDEAWTGVVVGVFGWLGADVTIVFLERIVFEKFGLKSKKEKE